MSTLSSKRVFEPETNLPVFDTFKDLNQYYADKYGEAWEREGRSCLSADEEYAFVCTCFDIYAKTRKIRETYQASFGDQSELNGKPFKIVRRASEPDFDLCALPAYIIEIDGKEFAAYPEEVFEE